MLNTLLQDGAQEAADALGSEEPVEKTLSIIDLLLTGGTAGIIIIAVLFVLLFVAIYIYFERLFAIKAASKIDGNFIRDILNDPIDLAMVTSIRDVAEAMKIKTVAEFVETPEIMVQIGKLGVDFAQGYCIAKPEPLATYENYSELDNNKLA